ncbi:uncharacterized protein L3040_005422 [Drepanopeziza brunnea f. sp. 'multigermtubi']|uniref:uncharacterized protein n=1 Tax=Drepanopeziza brunnea f. sp. 'multigermtubi' TaxID=698441 RepID=UPI00239C2B16|nr:hypothetical protein L3040_005422 [Drepanopeziza brunnea f. sp. 'multigermtubi']
MTDLQAACYSIVSTFFAASTLTIALRIYSRGFVTKGFGWDDWCMVVTFFLNCGHQVILYYFIRHGGGKHAQEVIKYHPEWLQKLTTTLFVEEIYYVLMHFIIKMTFLLFYLRFATKGFRTLVHYSIALNCIFAVVQWLLYCLQCIPLDAYFHHNDHPTVKCLENSVLAFVPASLNIFMDIVILVLPIKPLWMVQLSLRKRLQLLSIISLGGIVVVISVLRLTVLLEFQKFTDFTHSLGKIIIVSCIELEVAIMAANVPSLKIFFATSRGATAGRTGSKQSSADHNGNHIMANLTGRPQSKGRFLATTSMCRISASKGPSQLRLTTPGMGDTMNSSEEELAYAGIHVTSSVGVEYHDAKRASTRDSKKSDNDVAVKDMV